MSADRSGNRSAWCPRECAELIAVMSEQEQACRRLLELSAGERAAVLDGRMDDIEHSTREKASLIEQMERWEQRRRLLADGLAREVGLPADASLITLAARMDEQTASDLLDLRDRVGEAFASLKDSNQTNLLLMRKSLELVRDSIRQLRHSTGAGDTYTSDGRTSAVARGNIVVDCHA